MDESWIHHAHWNKTACHKRQILDDSTYNEVLRGVKCLEKSRRLFFRGKEEEEKSSYFLIDTEFEFYKMKRAMKMDGVLSAHTMNVLFYTTDLYTLND